MTGDEAIDAGAKALREHDMAGRITVEWERLPNGQKRKWRKKAAVVLTAANAAAWRTIESAPIGTHAHDRIAVGFEGQFGWILFTAFPNGKDTAVPGYAKPTHWMPLPVPPQQEGE